MQKERPRANFAHGRGGVVISAETPSKGQRKAARLLHAGLEGVFRRRTTGVTVVGIAGSGNRHGVGLTIQIATIRTGRIQPRNGIALGGNNFHLAISIDSTNGSPERHILTHDVEGTGLNGDQEFGFFVVVIVLALIAQFIIASNGCLQGSCIQPLFLS